ncbi:MAG: hypothetical protein JWM98_1272 [Thermoleophilia bacterium]|nr:hypothetical protein [Thermoleophilia bacterium]
MDRITHAWSGLSRRERLLAGGVAGAVLLVLLVVLAMGRGPDPVVGATAGEAAPGPAPPVKAAPGTIVVNRTAAPPPTSGAPAATGGGVAPLSVASDDSTGAGTPSMADPEGARLEAQARTQWKDVPAEPARFVPPANSEAVKLAGRDLERVAKAYADCVRNRPDTRPCMQVIQYGVYTKDNVLDDGHGIVLMKQSSDGHTLRLAVTDAADCRMLDDGPSCDAWRAG